MSCCIDTETNSCVNKIMNSLLMITVGADESHPATAEAQPRPQYTMEGDGGGVGARRGDQLPLLQVGQCTLNRAAGETGAGGNGLMRHADRPVGVLGRVTIEMKVNDERRRTPVVAYEVRQKAIDHIGVECYLYHQSL
jgi:hypothetical protein